MQAPWQELLKWWFGPGDKACDIVRDRHRLWFGYRPEQDDEARQRFGCLCDEALHHGLEDWSSSDQGWLALILLLDQLPRMIYRGTPRAFAGDERAQQLVYAGMERGRDQALPPVQRVFIYIVLEHAEQMADQDLAVAQFTALRDLADEQDRPAFDDFLIYAERHRDVIRRFGRFPHRNAILGRLSSEAERGYLARPGTGF